MTSLTWLHLSDWHQHGRLLSRANVGDALLEDIKDRVSIAPELADLDFIVFTGDLAQSGKPEEYEALATQFLEPLLQVTGVPRNRLFVVPGNHDVERKYVLGPAMLQRLADKEAVHAVVTDARRLGQFLETQGSYKAFVQGFLGDSLWPEPRWGWSRTFEVDGLTVGIAGINSAWLAGYNLNSEGKVDDERHLIISEQQVRQVLDGIEHADIRLAMLHHPFEWLVPFETQRIQRMLQGKCHFILTGHAHMQNLREIKDASGHAVFVPAGSAYNQDLNLEYSNAYNFIRLDLRTGRGKAFFRGWNERQSRFLIDVGTSSDGTYDFPLPKDLGRVPAGEPKPPPEASPSLLFAGDIQGLQDRTRLIMPVLANFASLNAGGKELRIERAVVRAIGESSAVDSIIVVGEPGAGKSGALYQLVNELVDDCHDVVLLAADRLNADGQGTLRNDLRLQHDLVDVLQNWPGDRPGYLVIDALDAARSVLALRTYVDIIRSLIRGGSRWRVVVSIRKFDLRYNRELQEIFRGNPPFGSFSDPEFERVKHINVPVLSDDELEQIRRSSPELNLLLSAGPTLTDLLRNPFNLRLAGLIVGHGANVGDLAPVTTQVELLAHYWQYRVLRDDRLGDVREGLLRRAAGCMLQRRSLNASRADVFDPACPQQLEDLLSVGVLVEWPIAPHVAPDRYLLGFSHHVLFDYAVSRLILRGEADRLLTRLIAEPELILAIRPSISLYFQGLWIADPTRRAFWDLAITFAANQQVSEVSKVVGPAVAAVLTKCSTDLEPLLSALVDPETPRKVAAEGNLRHTVSALTGLEANAPSKPWSIVAERLSRQLNESTAPSVLALLNRIDEPEELDHDELSAVGIAARRLLDFALSQQRESHWLILQGIQNVCRTYASDSTVSRESLGRILEETHWSSFGHLEIRVLADQVPRLSRLDPGLATELYIRAFEYEEQSRETTRIGGSRILPLSSNRKQDYEVGQHLLAQRFKSFLRVAPVAATRCLSRVLQAYAKRRHWFDPVPEPPTFDVNGRSVELLEDDSRHWDDGDIYDHDEPVMMLNEFAAYGREIASKAESGSMWRDFVATVGSDSQSAALWRRLFRVAAEVGGDSAKELLPIAVQPALLTSADTIGAVSAWLRVTFALLTPEERSRMEAAILALKAESSYRTRGARRKEALLGCLPTDALVTEEAKLAQSALKAPGPSPEGNGRGYGVSEVVEQDDRENESTEIESDQALSEVRRLLRQEELNAEAVRKALPPVWELWTQVSADSPDVLHEGNRVAWVELARACSFIASTSAFAEVREAIDLVRVVALRAARFPETREYSAYGLAHCCATDSVPNAEAVSAFTSLCSDESGLVRFAAAGNIRCLNRCCPDSMWALVTERTREETDVKVLIRLVSSLNCLPDTDSSRIVGVVRQVLARAADLDDAKLLREACVAPLIRFYLNFGQVESEELLSTIVDNPDRHLGEVGRVVANCRFALTHGLALEADAQSETVRQRGWAMLLRTLHATMRRFQQIQETLRPDQKVPDEIGSTLTGLVHIMDSIGDQVYFASGALYEKDTVEHPEERTLSPHEKRRFLVEASSLVGALADIGLNSVTHHLLETLESVIEVDPGTVLRHIGRVVVAGRSGGYQYESLALGVFLRIVDRYLAEFRHVLREDLECQRILLRMLDVFVEAGWTEAHRLVYRLEEVYR